MHDSEAYRIGDWTFVVGRNALQNGDGTDIRIEDRAARVLLALCQRAGQVVTKEELVARIWVGRTVSEHSLAVVISDLRRALDDDARTPRHIETVPKRGYRLLEATPVDPVTKRAGEPQSGDADSGAATRPFRGVRSVIGLAVSVLLLLTAAGLYFALSSPQPQERSPIIITLNNVTNATGDPTLDHIATAFSEIGAAKLAQAERHILIRDRWDFDADDPSRGLFEDFDRSSQVYHVTGKIVLEDERPAITMFADDPATGAVVWSDSFTFGETNFSARLRQSLDGFLATIESS